LNNVSQNATFKFIFLVPNFLNIKGAIVAPFFPV